jgi:hypothetical protein
VYTIASLFYVIVSNLSAVYKYILSFTGSGGLYGLPMMVYHSPLASTIPRNASRQYSHTQSEALSSQFRLCQELTRSSQVPIVGGEGPRIIC